MTRVFQKPIVLLTSLHGTIQYIMELVKTSGTAISYIAGCLHGDAWCSDNSFGLHVKDLDFCESFAVAVREVSTAKVRPNKAGPYWRISVKPECFSGIKSYAPQGDDEKAAWVRGMFDSEGCAYFQKMKKHQNSYYRRVGFSSTNMDTLEKCMGYMLHIGINSKIVPIKSTNGHLGSLPVYELRVAHSQDDFRKFCWHIGSNINRKLEKLRMIALAYSLDLASSMRMAQKISSANRRKESLEVSLPEVLSAIREMTNKGIPATQRRCVRDIPRYASMLNYFQTSEISKMAVSGVIIKPTKKRRLLHASSTSLNSPSTTTVTPTGNKTTRE